MNKKLSIALIGCGRISGKHADVITKNESLILQAACDIDRIKVGQLAKKTGAMAFYNHKVMVEKIRPDITTILVESGKHVEVALDVLPYTKNLIVEKPLALTLDSADKLIEQCDIHGVRLFVVKQNRYNRAVVRLRESFNRGRFGKIVIGTVRVRWCRTQEYYNQDVWRGTWSMDGGVFANQASHHIDLLQWFLGPVESVKAYIATRLVDIETEDTALAIMKFTSGALGLVEATTATRPTDLEGSLSILGEKGTVVVSGFAVNKIKTWCFVDRLPEDEDIETSCENPPNVYGFGHAEFYRDVIQCIENNTRSMLDGLEGRKSLELITAFYESAFTGREINFRYVPQYIRLGVNKRSLT